MKLAFVSLPTERNLNITCGGTQLRNLYIILEGNLGTLEKDIPYSVYISWVFHFTLNFQSFTKLFQEIFCTCSIIIEQCARLRNYFNESSQIGIREKLDPQNICAIRYTVITSQCEMQYMTLYIIDLCKYNEYVEDQQPAAHFKAVQTASARSRPILKLSWCRSAGFKTFQPKGCNMQ